MAHKGCAKADALPTGHACGHNLIAVSTLASAIAVAAIMGRRRIPGRVIVMGTPGEESGGGKDLMARQGAWKDCDAAIMQHPMPSTSICGGRPGDLTDQTFRPACAIPRPLSSFAQSSTGS